MRLFQTRWLFAWLVFSFSITLQAAPDLVLLDPSGQSHNINEYVGHGKWTVLNIWGPGCPPCEDEMPDLVRFHDQHAESDAIVVGIAIDFPSYGYADKQKVMTFADEYLIDFPLLLSDASVTEQLGLGTLQGLPTTFVFTPSGEIAGMQVGGISATVLEDFINRHSDSSTK